MHYSNKKTVFKINYEGTLKNIKEAIDQIRPHFRDGKQRSAIKGNVNATAYHIYRLFMRQFKKTTKVSTAFRTTQPSLAKVSNNCKRTVQRHIDKLIELKIILGKVHVGRGIQLLLNQSLLAFDAREVMETLSKAFSAPAAASQEIVQDAARALALFREKFPSARPGAPLRA